MSDSTTNAYSIWLAPNAETPAYRRLQETIAECAAAHDTPVFEPHITVIGGVSRTRSSLTETLRRLAAETPPLEVAFEGVRCSTTRHQCVFLSVRPSPTLLNLHESARETVGEPPLAYHPHLSLVYGDLGIDRRFEITDSLDTESLPGQIECSVLTLVDTTGPEAAWDPVASVSLSNR